MSSSQSQTINRIIALTVMKGLRHQMLGPTVVLKELLPTEHYQEGLTFMLDSLFIITIRFTTLMGLKILFRDLGL